MDDIVRLAPDAAISDQDLRFMMQAPAWQAGTGFVEPLNLDDGRFFEKAYAPQPRFSWIGRPELARVSQQAPFSTCFSHGLCRALETLRAAEQRPPVRLDPELFHQCVLGLDCTVGIGSPERLINSFITHGAPASTGQFKPGERCPPVSTAFRCAGARQISDIATAERAIAQYRPIVAVVSVEPRFANVTDFSVYRDAGHPRTFHHALLLVGFDREQRYWEVQNSMGTAWGRQGYGRLAYNSGQLFEDADHNAYLLYGS